MDNRNIAGALLTDLFKVFDWLNHELLIAKHEVYAFHGLIIETGVPQGSIMSPLIFNIYMNDIFYFIREEDLANYADGNTPYAIKNEIEGHIVLLKKMPPS